MEEYAVQVVVVILAGMSQDSVKVVAAFFDYSRETDNLRTGTDDDEKFEFSVIFER